MARAGHNPANGTLKTDANLVTVDRGYIAHHVVSAANAVAASATAVHAAITLADGATTAVTTAITNPGAPRALSITGNAATATGDVVIEGTNYAGEAITETIVSTGAATVDGAKAFKTVTKITVPARGDVGNTISVGFNDKLGLPCKLAHNTVLAAYLNHTKESNAATVAVSATALESNTVDLNSALNGGQVDLYFIV